MYKFSAPTSPTLSARTSNSIAHSTRTAELVSEPIVVLSRADIRASFDAYEQLLSSAKIYRNRMMELAQATAGFGQALERIARCKGALDSGPALQAAAGLHYLMSNHQQILSDTFYKKFEIPLLDNLDVHKANVLASEENYEKSLTEMSRRIKETEAENLRSGRRRQRDLSQFRKALQDLTRQVEELDRLKTEYYRQTLETEQNNNSFILSKVSTVVRAEVDIYERISNKGVSDSILEGMINQGTDPFSPYPTADQSSEIFSILPPVPIISPVAESNNNVTTSSTTDLPTDGYNSNGVKTRSTLSTLTDDDGEEESEFITKTTISRHTRDNSHNSNQYHDEEYDQFDSERSAPLKFHRASNGTSSNQFNSSVGSDTPSIGRHFNPSLNPGFHISDDAELLHDKEFAYGVEDSGFEGSLASNSTDYGKSNETKEPVFLKAQETTVSNPPLEVTNV